MWSWINISLSQKKKKELRWLFFGEIKNPRRAHNAHRKLPRWKELWLFFFSFFLAVAAIFIRSPVLLFRVSFLWSFWRTNEPTFCRQVEGAAAHIYCFFFCLFFIFVKQRLDGCEHINYFRAVACIYCLFYYFVFLLFTRVRVCFIYCC